MEKVLFKLSLLAIFALLLIGAAFIVRVRTGKSFDTVLVEYKWLPGVALAALVILVIGVVVAFLIINN